MLMQLSQFKRLGAKTRRDYFDGLALVHRQVGMTGAPEVQVTRDDGRITWVPVAYCLNGEFKAVELLEMVKQCKPKKEAPA